MISTISHVKNIDLRYVLQSHDNRAVLSTSLVSIDTSFPTQNILSPSLYRFPTGYSGPAGAGNQS